MEEELLQKLLGYIETTSPVVWEAMMKQVQVETVQRIILFILLSVFLLIVARGLLVLWKEDSDVELVMFVSCLGIGGGMVWIYLLMKITGLLINPNYYAIRNLLSFLQ